MKVLAKQMIASWDVYRHLLRDEFLQIECPGPQSFRGFLEELVPDDNGLSDTQNVVIC